MRVQVGKALRVSPGDEVVARALLPASSRLGRLFVFSKELGGSEFSPYVPDPGVVVSNEPMMRNMVSLRLTRELPERITSFTVDFDGHVCVMQEVDGPNDPKVKIKLRRNIPRYLPFMERLQRRIQGYIQ